MTGSTSATTVRAVDLHYQEETEVTKMNRASYTPRTYAVCASAAVAAALVLAGCGKSSGSGADSTSSPAASSHAVSGTASASSAAGTSGGSATDVSALFPIAVGNTWVYTEQLGTGKGMSTNRMTAVTATPDGKRVTMAISTQLQGVPTASTATHVIFVFHPNGSITIPLTQFAGTAVQIKSGSVLWPGGAQLASGQPNHDTLVITVTEGGQTTTLDAHMVVKGAGTATVTVPAGTYRATVITETMTERIEGFTVDTEIRNWVANGVGPVKTEVLATADGRTTVSSVAELKSFTKA